MTRIYKRSDRIKVKIDDVIVTLAPMTLDQKTECQNLIAHGRLKNNFALLTDGIVQAIRYSLKDIEGLKNADDSSYKLSFENEVVTKDCIDDLFNIEMHKKLTLVCAQLVATVPSEFTDQDGKPIEGVEILKSQEKNDPN